MPAILQVDAVRGNASRERSTAADCDSGGGNRCRPSRFLFASQAVDATTSNSVNVQQHGKFRYLQVSQQTEVGDVRIGHAIVATGRFNPILMHPTSVTIGLEPLVPFVTGGPFVWTRGVPVVDQTAKCVRTQIPTGSELWGRHRRLRYGCRRDLGSHAGQPLPRSACLGLTGPEGGPEGPPSAFVPQPRERCEPSSNGSTLA